jgi:hypothetical protein
MLKLAFTTTSTPASLNLSNSRAYLANLIDVSSQLQKKGQAEKKK